MTRKIIGYFYDEGIRYEVYDTDSDMDLGEHQDRNYGRTEKIIDSILNEEK